MRATIGGDFCVTLNKPGERSWAYLLGDVEGHSYKAALTMLALITAFKIVHNESNSPNYVLQQLASSQLGGDYRATALCFVCFEHQDDGPVRRFIKAASAAHPPLLVVHKKGLPVEELPKLGGPATTQLLGIGPLSDFAEECIEVFPGDLLIGYTDGVVEAEGDTEAFTKKDVAAAALANFNKPPREIAEAILRGAKCAAQDILTDDIIIVVIRITDK